MPVGFWRCLSELQLEGFISSGLTAERGEDFIDEDDEEEEEIYEKEDAENDGNDGDSGENEDMAEEDDFFYGEDE